MNIHSGILLSRMTESLEINSRIFVLDIGRVNGLVLVHGGKDERK